MFEEEDIKKLVEKALDVALVKFKQEFYQDSEVILHQVLKVSPENPNAMQLLGLIQHAKHNYEEASQYFIKLLEKNPQDSENLNNLALCYSCRGDFKKSIELLEKAASLKPNSNFLLSNLGLQYRNDKNTEKAIELFKESLSISPSSLTWTMLGGCYGELKMLDEAENCFLKALELEPDFPGAHVDLAYLYKIRNQYDKSWEHYEHRHEVFEQLNIFKRIFEPNKKWDGENPLGKRILVHGEQGMGDYIHFVRYVKILKERGAYIILQCDKILERIFKPLADELFVIDPNEIPPYHKRGDFQMPKYDFHCSVMSLPYLLKTSEIPNLPYLKISEKIDLSKYNDFFKIGIVWSGNPQHPNDKNRSCELSKFSELHDIENVKLFSLVTDKRPRLYRFEKEPIDLAAGNAHMKIVDMSPVIKDFYDTATILNSLDLLITVDTSSLHLAGAMGLPAWALIAWDNDWRWGLEKQNSIWYPSIKLFRQSSSKNWDEVFNKLKKEVSNEQRVHRKK